MRASILLCAAALLLLPCGCQKGRRSQATDSFTTAAPAQVREGGNLQRVQASGRLRIGVKADSPPFCFQDADGNPQGFDVDLGYRLARALKLDAQFVTVSGPERVERLKRGEVDVVIATLTATRSRDREIDFSLPYFQDQQSLLVKADSPLQSYRDMSGKRIAAVTGSTSIDNLRKVSPDAQVVAAASLTDAFAKLESGGADAVTGDRMALLGFKLKAAQPERYRIAGEGFSAEPYAIGLPENDSPFRARIDEALTELWVGGAWTVLFNKWLGPRTPYNLEANFQMPILPP